MLFNFRNYHVPVSFICFQTCISVSSPFEAWHVIQATRLSLMQRPVISYVLFFYGELNLEFFYYHQLQSYMCYKGIFQQRIIRICQQRINLEGVVYVLKRLINPVLPQTTKANQLLFTIKIYSSLIVQIVINFTRLRSIDKDNRKRYCLSMSYFLGFEPHC